MTSDATTPQSNLERALGSSVALLAGMYIVARPIANQFVPYSGEAAFAGFVAVLLAFCVGLKSLLGKRPLCAPDGLTLAVILWLGLFLWGALRSPNLGVAVPLACDAAIYMALLLCGCFVARRDPALLSILTRVLVAMVAVEAFAAVWQRYVDLPSLWHDIRAGRERLPEALESSLGQYRLYGHDVFGTFGNPNSLAAYLVMGVFLVAALWHRQPLADDVRRPFRRASLIRVLLIVWLLLALTLTNSKGAAVALCAGAWFFYLQRAGLDSPKRGRILAWLTVAGILAVLAVLALGIAGAYAPPRSLAVRFEYWRAALGMIREHPLDGVGLGGFSEYYSRFKTPLGTETREAHNDYLHLWTELGVLGPLAYLALWAMLLKSRAGNPAPLPLPQGEKADDDGRAAALEKWAVLGGVFGFGAMFCAFTVFNSADVIPLLHGVVTRQAVYAALHTLALPVIFACVVVGLRSPSLLSSSAELTTWTHGLRAAAGAVLIHQLVDFDFKAQAVMGGLLLLAGMLFALRQPAEEEPLVAPSPLARLSRYLLPALAVLLVPGAAWIPMRAGLPRAAADALEDEARRLAREKPAEDRDLARDKTHREMRRDIAELRLSAAQAAPFDGSAWLDLAAAYEGMQQAHGSASMRPQVLSCLAEGERLRPVSAAAQLMYADFYFRSGMRALHRREKPGHDFEWAANHYAAAAERYPLAPGFRILAGDALLMCGRFEAAAARYLEALEVDALILDGNVRLSAILTDPRPGAAARHGSDAEVLSYLSTLRSPPKAAARGLLVRRFSAAATILRTSGQKAPLPAGLIAALRAELLNAGKVLAATLDDPAARAHAALLHALAFELAGPGQDDAKAAAWQLARKLQQESVGKGTPGTPPYLFDLLAIEH